MQEEDEIKLQKYSLNITMALKIDLKGKKMQIKLFFFATKMKERTYVI